MTDSAFKKPALIVGESSPAQVLNCPLDGGRFSQWSLGKVANIGGMFGIVLELKSAQNEACGPLPECRVVGRLRILNQKFLSRHFLGWWSTDCSRDITLPAARRA